MGTIADAKFTHYDNCYNGYFSGCLLQRLALRKGRFLNKKQQKRCRAGANPYTLHPKRYTKRINV